MLLMYYLDHLQQMKQHMVIGYLGYSHSPYTHSWVDVGIHFKFCNRFDGHVYLDWYGPRGQFIGHIHDCDD